MSKSYLVAVYNALNKNLSVWWAYDPQPQITDPYLTNSTKCFSGTKCLEAKAWRKNLGFQWGRKKKIICSVSSSDMQMKTKCD